ncbi:replicative DNA helicase [Oscillibacter valericigenes Sjm18-20]|nr:replicative DNA helicase [Oscillibacter valericigenes Sjm18-20]
MQTNAMLSQTMLDAQQGVLGSMLIDPDTVGPVLSKVQASDFTIKQYRTIFQTIQALFRAGKPVDGITVSENAGSQFRDILVQLINCTPTAANVDEYVALLKRSSTLYYLQELGTQLSTADTLDDAQVLLDKAMQTQVSKPGVQSMTFAEGYEQFFDRHDGEKKPVYLSWGVPVLDERVFAEPGDMVIIAGRTSDGKTALALQFVAGIGLKHRVGYFSYESTKDKLFDRHVSNAAMLSYTTIKRNNLSEADYNDLLELKDKLTAPQVRLIDAAGMTVLDIQAYSQAHHFDVIVVDYLQKVASPSWMRREKEYDRVTDISSSLQQFGRVSDTTIIALSQLSRGERDKKTGKVRDPVISDLRSSGQIEQDADVIMLLYREDYDDKQSNRILQLAKNKEGEILDKVRFKFDGDRQTFSRIAPGADEPVHKVTPAPRSAQIRMDEITSPRTTAEIDEVFPPDKEGSK